jgi:hypothetical protein
MNSMMKCPTSGLFLPQKHIDEKESLKKVINDFVEKAVNAFSYVKDNYFLVFHAKFDPINPENFNIDCPKACYKIPPFMSNQMVFWVSPKRGLCELLWMVAPKKKGEKLKVEFNKTGVAYLQAKGAMPS